MGQSKIIGKHTDTLAIECWIVTLGQLSSVNGGQIQADKHLDENRKKSNTYTHISKYVYI